MNLSLAPTPLVAILRGVTPDEADLIAAAIPSKRASARSKFRSNSPDPLASIEIIARLFGDKVLVGAGTVLEAREVDEVAEAGAKLIVAPNADHAVIERAAKLGLAALPGVGTPTEAFAALEGGSVGAEAFSGRSDSPRGRAGVAVGPAEGRSALSGRRNHARAHRPVPARRRERLRRWLGAVQARRER